MNSRLLVYSFVSTLGFVPYAIFIYSIFRECKSEKHRDKKDSCRKDEDKVKNGIENLVKLKSLR